MVYVAVIPLFSLYLSRSLSDVDESVPHELTTHIANNHDWGQIRPKCTGNVPNCLFLELWRCASGFGCLGGMAAESRRRASIIQSIAWGRACTSGSSRHLQLIFLKIAGDVRTTYARRCTHLPKRLSFSLASPRLLIPPPPTASSSSSLLSSGVVVRRDSNSRGLISDEIRRSSAKAMTRRSSSVPAVSSIADATAATPQGQPPRHVFAYSATWGGIR